MASIDFTVTCDISATTGEVDFITSTLSVVAPAPTFSFVAVNASATLVLIVPTPVFKMYSGVVLDIRVSPPVFEIIATNSIPASFEMVAPTPVFSFVGDSENVATLNLNAPSPTMSFGTIPASMGSLNLIAPTPQFSMEETGESGDYVMSLNVPTPIFQMIVGTEATHGVLRYVRGEVR